nr:hypothetical protein [Tanacetum cinerariifolium]
MSTNVIFVYKTKTFSLIDKKDIKVENVMDLCWSPTDPIFALYVPELNDGNQPARVCLFQIPGKEELRQKNLFSVSDCKMDWQTMEKPFTAIYVVGIFAGVDKYNLFVFGCSYSYRQKAISLIRCTYPKKNNEESELRNELKYVQNKVNMNGISCLKMTNDTNVTAHVNVTGAPVTNTVANHAEKLEKFNGQNFKRWQQKMFFCFTILNLGRFLEETAPQNFKRWQQKMFFYLTTLNLARFLKETAPQVEPPKEGQPSNAQPLERKYKTEDAGTKKFAVACFLDYKMVDSKNVITRVQDLQILIHEIHAEGMTHKQKETSVEDLIVCLCIKKDNKLAQKNTYAPGKKKNDKKGKGKAEYLAPKARIVKQKFRGTCYNCDQPGHRAANCKMPKRVNPCQANMVNDSMDMIAMVSDVIAMIFKVNLPKFDESFHEAWERYKDLLRACPHHGFTELHQLDTFYNALNPADQDSLNAVAAQVKAVEEICVTCGGAHPYYQCLAAGGNTFPEYRDNIQGYVSAATGNYNQGNLGYRPQGVANQMRPPDIVSFNDIHPHFDDNPLSGSTTYSSNSLLEEFTDELALITYTPNYDDNLKCDIKS